MTNQTGFLPRVFHVDDNTAIRQAVGALMEFSGHRVVSCQSGSELFSHLGDAGPGCVLLDVDLAGENGLDICRQLQEVASHLPVLFLSGNASPSLRGQVKESAAIGLLRKPCEGARLLEAIDSALQIGELRWRTHCFEREVARLPEPDNAIIKMISNGADTHTICQSLGVNWKLGESQIQSALARLDMDSIDEVPQRLDRQQLV